MRAMVFDHYGEPDVMRLRDVPVPEPQDLEVLIRVDHAGVNPADSKARAGHSARAGYRYREVDFPFVTGMDAAGVVERTGSAENWSSRSQTFESRACDRALFTREGAGAQRR